MKKKKRVYSKCVVSGRGRLYTLSFDVKRRLDGGESSKDIYNHIKNFCDRNLTDTSYRRIEWD